ncbi:MAG: hypothetical protein MUP16_08800 [Sedimentisphaerales bacterium]|nr:hypothetical protein [Sedimentisphaerales bacterium]
MRLANDIHKIIKKLQLKASAELDERVHNDISQTLVKLQKIKPARTEQNIRRRFTKGWGAKLAVAAAILIAFGIGFSTGRWSKPAPLAPRSLNVADYTLAVSLYSTSLKVEDSFWQQKALAVMQPRPYAQSQFDKTSLLNTYKQYLKEKHYD